MTDNEEPRAAAPVWWERLLDVLTEHELLYWIVLVAVAALGAGAVVLILLDKNSAGVCACGRVLYAP